MLPSAVGCGASDPRNAKRRECRCGGRVRTGLRGQVNADLGLTALLAFVRL